MASIRQQGSSWQTRVRRKGYPDITKSFNTRKDAERWARSVETSLDRGTYIDPTEAEKVTLGDLIDRYIKEALPSMKGYVDDSYRLKATQTEKKQNREEERSRRTYPLLVTAAERVSEVPSDVPWQVHQ